MLPRIDVAVIFLQKTEYTTPSGFRKKRRRDITHQLQSIASALYFLEFRKKYHKIETQQQRRLGDVIVDDADKTQIFENGYVRFRTVFADEGDYIWDMYQHEEEWKEIDRLVMTYQAQFKESAGDLERYNADRAGTELMERFKPLFKKYVILLTTGQINFRNTEQKQFVRLFMPDRYLQKALGRKNISRDLCDQILQKFNFLIEGYGHQPEEEIYDDLRVIFFILVKRYKNVGRSFCCYVYNLFKYEVSRFVQRYQRNPANFHYKVTTLDECNKTSNDDYSAIEDTIYEDEWGLPDATWVHGETCSDLFQNFTDEERLIFSKYYLQDWNDGQIAKLLGMHINTANQKRKAITHKLSELLGYNPKDIQRHRKSGKKAIIDRNL